MKEIDFIKKGMKRGYFGIGIYKTKAIIIFFGIYIVTYMILLICSKLNIH